MHIGISLQNNQGLEDVQSIIQLARRAEELGFASVWVHDHEYGRNLPGNGHAGAGGTARVP